MSSGRGEEAKDTGKGHGNASAAEAPATEAKEEKEEALRGRFIFRRANTGCSYQGYIGNEEYSDAVPENTECALRGLSEEELGQTGPQGSLLHLLIRRYGADLPEMALDLFPHSVLSARDEHGQTVLHAIAAFGGRAATLERVLQRIGLEALAIPSTNGTLPLHLAAMNSLRWPPAVLEAVSQEAIAPRTAQGANLLHFLAAQPYDKEIVAFFVEKLPQECLIQRDQQGRTPLHVAAALRHLSSALPLMEASPVEALSMEDHQGFCPLELALFKGESGGVLCTEEALLALVDGYVKKGVMATKKEWQVTSPLHLALDQCGQMVIDALLACPQAREWALIPDPETGVLPIHYAVGKHMLFNRLDSRPLMELMAPEDLATPIKGSTRTALHLAVISDNSRAGMQLLDLAGASFDVDALDFQGRSLLLLGLTMGIPRGEGPVELLKRVVALSESDCPLAVPHWRLINHHVDVSLLVEVCSRYKSTFFEGTTVEDWEGGSTPLYCACYTLHNSGTLGRNKEEEYRRDLATLLGLVPEWFVTVRNMNGHTPMSIAAICGNAIAVELLLQLPSGAKAAEMVVEAHKPRHFGTPLEAAMQGAHGAVVKEFVAVMTDFRSIRTAEGGTLAELAESLHNNKPQWYREVKAAFEPAVKSAADC